MQLLATEDYYFIKSVKTILRCCRKSGEFLITNHSVLANLKDIKVFGDVHCCLGKINIENVNYLLLVIECTEVAQLEHCDSVIYRIDKVCALPILLDGFVYSRLFNKNINDNFNNLNKLKNHHKKIVKFVSNKVLPNSKFIDYIVRFINESSNFYFSFTTDLTLTVQKKSESNDAIKSDDNYFWNKNLLKDFYTLDGLPIPKFKEWIVPIIFGFVKQQNILFEPDTKAFFTLISRRSLKRAGVRYLRRGIDKNGHVANFVETEFIINVFGHCLSFVQIRGSVPIFWSQKGYQFRPPLSIDGTFDQSMSVFEKHINSLIKIYGKFLVIVSLVEQNGRELCLGEAFLQHIIELDSEDIAFIAFDFHKNCKTLKFHKVSEMVGIISKEIASIGFCWLDKNGLMVRKQDGIIRTNCVDCLDRTNIVQCAISQAVCLIQTKKLGLIEPEVDEFENIKLKQTEEMIKIIQEMWADHGDSISKQYAGTNALKGDVTRSGQRKLIGLMKDSYNSASRYYLSQFQDAQRQKIIDALLTGSDQINNNSNITLEIDNKESSSLWYDDDLTYLEEDEDETNDNLLKMSFIDLPPHILNNEEKNDESKKDKNICSNNILNDWIMPDTIKKKIAHSGSKIIIL